MTPCDDLSVVQFVYFVESDQPFDPSYPGKLTEAAHALQRYWQRTFGGTFALASPPVRTLRGEHPARWYISTPDGIHEDPRWYRLGNLKKEVFAAFDREDFDPHIRWVVLPVAREDGRVGGNFGGVFMDGDDTACLAGDARATYPYDEDGPAQCLGHLAHELGHTFGLEHTGPKEDCMQKGFYIKVGGDEQTCRFFPANVAAVLDRPENAPWLGARPEDACPLRNSAPNMAGPTPR